MERIEISDEVLDFLARRIDSVPQLEALLLFWEQPDSAWTADQIAARVYVSREKARQTLQDLVRHGFVIAATDIKDGYRYQPAWDALQLMPKVATTYRQHLVHVAELIHAKAEARETSSVHEFARAFKFKQKE